MSEESKTVVGLLNKVAAEICNDYCRWPWVYRDGNEEDEGKMYEEKCSKCPLSILGL
jgi:hypothetical protein